FLTTIEKAVDEEIGPHALPIIISEQAAFNRSEFTKHLEKNGIDTRTLFSSIPTQCLGYTYLGYSLGDFPNAEYIGENAIHIGVHQDLGKKECDFVLEVIGEFLKI
ncbi:MAG: DegT/DnrJ/EryC1/StrS family aminotransferase, partial [Candidatus Omnitrophica bacterium]|nr:DegT/DnrJ/EryC1/StrS family aminotransferase [Candidatus Omnitrophota bacterium]